MPNDRLFAYFTMEIALDPGMSTYSGGLGVLAGDTIRSAADLKVPVVVVSLLHRKGYFYQRLDDRGQQTEEPVEWAVNDFLTEMPERAAVSIEGRELQLRAWKYEVKGVSGYEVPVYFLDTDLPENSPGTGSSPTTSTAATTTTACARRSSWESAASGCSAPWDTMIRDAST